MLPCALPLCAGRTCQRGHCPPASAAPSLCLTVVPAWTFPPFPPRGLPGGGSATAWSGASTPPVGPRRPEWPACGGGRGARAGLPAPSRLPLGAVGRGGGRRSSAAARRSPGRGPPAPACRRLPAAPARRGGRRRRGRGRCGYGSGTAVAAAVTGYGSIGRNGGDAGGSGPLLVYNQDKDNKTCSRRNPTILGQPARRRLMPLFWTASAHLARSDASSLDGIRVKCIETSLNLWRIVGYI